LISDEQFRLEQFFVPPRQATLGVGPPAGPHHLLDIPSRQTAANLTAQKLSWYVHYSFLLLHGTAEHLPEMPAKLLARHLASTARDEHATAFALPFPLAYILRLAHRDSQWLCA